MKLFNSFSLEISATQQSSKLNLKNGQGANFVKLFLYNKLPKLIFELGKQNMMIMINLESLALF